MTETQRRIRAYKKALPQLRERVIAVALLLAMSASMLGTASFAWITLSTAPEVSGMATTVAANGNLEIALVSPDGNVPLESRVGDSSASENQTIVNSNRTWGNLVNLSDPAYGLGHISLRPALLSDYNLDSTPLYGATYGYDGRVENLADQFKYVSWTKNEIDGSYYFAGGNKMTYGVRAISSVASTNTTGNAIISQFVSKTSAAYSEMNTLYAKMVSNDKNYAAKLDDKGTTVIAALQGLVKIYAQDIVDGIGGNPGNSSYNDYLPYFHKIMLLLDEVLDKEGELLLLLANWQAYIHHSKTNPDASNNTFETLDALLEADAATLTSNGVTLSTLEDYKSSRTTLHEQIEKIAPMAAECENPADPNKPVEYKWSDIQNIINKLVHIDSTTLDGTQLKDLGVDQAGDLLDGSKHRTIVISQGVLRDTEARAISENNNTRVAANVSITVKKIFPITVSGTVYTSASYDVSSKQIKMIPAAINADRAYTEGLDSSGSVGGEETGIDTYGFAIDLWARTNHPDAVLTLEGSPLYKPEQAMISVPETNDQGTTVNVEYPLYTMLVEEQTVEIYQDRENVWHYADGYGEISDEEMEGKSPVEKINQIVIGYQGENRIWEDWRDMMDAGLIEKDTTTQGSGSCFVFYADNPVEQMKIIDLLKSFTVAFLDENSKSIATAVLDTGLAYDNQGKVTVPLVVTSGVTFTDEDQQNVTGITRLTQNQPKRITAVIYLNGTHLENENVLTASQIQGQLNIQFGTSGSLEVFENEELMRQYRTITASVAVGNETSTHSTDPIELDYSQAGHNAVVTLNVEGEEPERITGFFIRMFNDSQGTRGEDITFAHNGEGTWTGTATLTAPGNYRLISLLVDGIQYNLHDDNLPQISIAGLSVGKVETVPASSTIMTADRSQEVTVTAKLDSQLDLHNVTAQFFSQDQEKQYIAPLHYDSLNDEWVGSVAIDSSGTYTLKYITADDQVIEVNSEDQTQLILYLGLSCDVETFATETSMKFTGEMLDREESFQLPMKVILYDDEFNRLEGFKGVKLYYREQNSSLEQNSLMAPMDWYGEGDYYGYYEGGESGIFDLTVPGTYQFEMVKIGSSEIRKAHTAPRFEANSPIPPAFVSARADGMAQAGTQTTYQLAINNPATVRATLSNAANAKVWAVFTNAQGQEQTVLYESAVTIATGKEYTFNLQTDGVWTLKKLKCQNVYDGEIGYPEGGANFYEIPIPTDRVVSTDVVATVNPIVKYGTSEKKSAFTVEFGGTKEAPTGDFMQSHTSEAFTITVTDGAGRAIPGANAIWSIQYDANTDLTYGGYDGASMNQNDITGFTLSDDGKTLQAPVQTFPYAGEYNTTKLQLQFDVNGDGEVDGTHDVTVMPAFAVSSKLPTVTVSSVSPTTANMPTKIQYSVGLASVSYKLLENKTNSIDTVNNTVTAYAEATTDGVGTGDAGFVNLPTVKFNVQGVDSSSTVKFTIPKGDASKAIEVSKTGNGETSGVTLGKTEKQYEKFIGLWGVGVTYTCYSYKGHGDNITIEDISIVRNGVTYTMALEKPIKIINPTSITTSS